MATVTKDGDDFLVKSPVSVKTHQRELGELLNKMIRAMGQQFKNQTLNSLDKRIVNKFEDAQVGNYSKVFMTLSDRTIRKIVKRFSDERIKSVVEKILNKVNKTNKTQLYGRVEDVTSLNAKNLIRSDGTVEETNALILETAAWVERLRDNTLQDFTANTLRAMALGQGVDEIGLDFNKLVTKQANHSRFLANNQVSNFNSILTKTRAQKLGITQAKWVTSHDEKVRKCHAVRDGKTFDLDKGLFSSCDGLWLLPGVDYNCRCHYQLIIPEEFAN